MLMETAASERDIQGHHHGSKDDTNNNKADNSNSNSSGDGGGGDDDDRRRAAATSRLVRGMYGNLHVSLVATTAELGRLSAEVNRRFIVPVGLVWACLFVDHALQFCQAPAFQRHDLASRVVQQRRVAFIEIPQLRARVRQHAVAVEEDR